MRSLTANELHDVSGGTPLGDFATGTGAMSAGAGAVAAAGAFGAATVGATAPLWVGPVALTAATMGAIAATSALIDNFTKPQSAIDPGMATDGIDPVETASLDGPVDEGFDLSEIDAASLDAPVGDDTASLDGPIGGDIDTAPTDTGGLDDAVSAPVETAMGDTGDFATTLDA
jgi:hypothetical protein